MTAAARPHPFVDVPGPVGFAHRGGARSGVENTMAAFGRAVDLGFRYVETDARVTADGVLVAFHDPDLRRLADRPERVRDLTWDELRGVGLPGGHVVPALAELLLAWPDLRVNVDVKEMAAVAPLARLLHELRALDRVCVGSFSGRRVAAAREAAGPRLATSLPPLAAAAGWVAAAATPLPWPARLVRSAVAAQLPPYAGPLPVVTRRLVEVCHDHGLAVHVWTVHEPAEMRRLLDLGVDGLMVDDLDAFLAVLRERGTGP